MTHTELAEKTKFATLKDGMSRLGLDPDGVDDKEEAIKATCVTAKCITA